MEETSSTSGVLLVREPVVAKVELAGSYTARFPELGLTAYGSTAEQATNRLRMMFHSAVFVRRDKDLLTEWLNKSGLEWHWVEK